jgi:hypothetical protein
LAGAIVLPRPTAHLCQACRGEACSDLRLFAPTNVVADYGGHFAGEETVSPEAIGLLKEGNVARPAGNNGNTRDRVSVCVALPIDVRQGQRLLARRSFRETLRNCVLIRLLK